jgi:hypothetical protein
MPTYFVLRMQGTLTLKGDVEMEYRIEEKQDLNLDMDFYY